MWFFCSCSISSLFPRACATSELQLTLPPSLLHVTMPPDKIPLWIYLCLTHLCLHLSLYLLLPRSPATPPPVPLACDPFSWANQKIQFETFPLSSRPLSGPEYQPTNCNTCALLQSRERFPPRARKKELYASFSLAPISAGHVWSLSRHTFNMDIPAAPPAPVISGRHGGIYIFIHYCSAAWCYYSWHEGQIYL